MGELKAPRGTADILPGESELWLRVERAVREVCRAAGYGEIRTPIFEHTELFERGVGAVTDIVEKEMYTFEDKAGRSMTLRPEGTAPCMRAYLEHNMRTLPQPVKMYYIGPMFRYERPQSGRFRQHTQFGVEAIGSPDPALDAEVVSILVDVYRRLGLSGFVVHLNSIGCPQCRPRYKEALARAVEARADDLCPDCRRRLGRNPLRILDCKNETCREISGNVPTIFGFLCEECRKHFDDVTRYLENLGLDHEIDSRIVRGLDYYTKTVFEVVHGSLGAQDVLGGGGRYDGLAEDLGGKHTPGVGFAAGIERAVMVLRALGSPPVEAETGAGIVVFVAIVGMEARAEGFRLVNALRARGVPADLDYMNRSLKAQMKHAGRCGARKVVILGAEELEARMATVKDMSTGEQSRVALSELVRVLSEGGNGAVDWR
ncbi:MAG: histidine--tRNA ligase [Firmicutes bacterium]|jgi:histidyl-tRNA synthetase|nr:histidine--tRNA ligase [Bacillota bacterium]MDH7495586.1 histidine--tRNA ligase [Bacillota bacterium]